MTTAVRITDDLTRRKCSVVRIANIMKSAREAVLETHIISLWIGARLIPIFASLWIYVNVCNVSLQNQFLINNQYT